ncbi:MAG: alpha-amylase family glycosyl hydrolase [Ilumatobacteraceae bacterium]
MTGWPTHPVVHEVFTWVWLRELSDQLARPVTLADVPSDMWDDIARPGFDAVWLMGVWERSPLGAAIARSNPSLRAAHVEALPDVNDDDVVGSAYCVRDYRVAAALGGEAGLRIAREELARRGARLVLDLVPNHVAPDHRWVDEHPEYFVQGTLDDLARDPSSFIQVGGRVMACGRDPYFPAWPEVAQLDAAHPAVRRAMTELVLDLSTRCDGLRCDMAMLLLDDVFDRTWGERGSRPEDDRGFWPGIIGEVKAARPDFRMWAEAYWDREPTLVEQGFDACYDKRLYDRIVHGAPPADIRAHLTASTEWQQRTVRFIENHDEPRAADAMSPDAHVAALTAVLTLPGVALVHEGELDGRRVRVPVTLGRRPVEAIDTTVRRRLEPVFEAVAARLRDGRWELAAVHGWPDNTSADRLLAWSWTAPTQRHLVVVNLSDARADGMVAWPWGDDAGHALALTDRISGELHQRDGDDLLANGLYVALPGPGVHLFVVERSPGLVP